VTLKNIKMKDSLLTAIFVKRSTPLCLMVFLYAVSITITHVLSYKLILQY